MERVIDFLASLTPTSLMPVAILLLACGAAAVALAAAVAAKGDRSDVKRRLKVDDRQRGRDRPSRRRRRMPAPVREKAVKTAQEFYAKSDPENVARLRMKLIQAGYMDPRAVGMFFLIRFGGFVGARDRRLSGQPVDGQRRRDRRPRRWTFIIMAGSGRLFPARAGADAADAAPRCASTATAFPTSWT